MDDSARQWSRHADGSEVLDFQNPDDDAPVYAVPPGPFSVPCPDQGDFNALIPLFKSYGWPL